MAQTIGLSIEILNIKQGKLGERIGFQSGLL
jgi:hypothetical protein